MRPERYLTAIGLSIFLALPVVAQTTSPLKTPNSPAAVAPKPPAAATPGTTEQPTGKSEKAGELVDINSASAEELDKLPGVGAARAKAIIEHRPYYGKDDLVNKKIIPSNIYAHIKDKIIARQK
jgi:competence ComEA-like helix-hairpin-helix protein